MRKFTLPILAALAVTGVCLQQATAAVTVTDSNPSGWAFNSFDVNGNVITDSHYTGAYVPGPATPPLGTGSAELAIDSGYGDGAEQLRNSNYANIPLSSLTELSYSTYTSSNNGQQYPYLSLYLSTDGSGTYDDKITFEPPYQTPGSGNPALPNQGATQLNTWQTWNALEGGWYSDAGALGSSPGTFESPTETGVQSLAAFEALYPNATIVNYGTLGGIRLAMGYAGQSDTDLAYVDNFSIGVAGNTTTYDFEPSAATPEPASLALLGVGALGLLARRRRTV